MEDDRGHAELVKSGFKRLGSKENILHLADGGKALAHLSQYSAASRDNPLPDLVILDLRLPTVDGLEILKEMKSNNRLKSIPVAILSTSDADQDKSRAQELGADGYYTKPWSFKDLCHVIEEISDRWLQ